MPRATPGAIRREITTIVVTKFQPASLVAELAGARRAGRRREPAPGGAGEGRGARVARPALALRRAAAEQEGEAGARVRQRHPLGRPARARRRAALRRGTRSTASCRSTSPRTPAAAGVAPDGLDELVEHVLGTPGLRLRGLMAVAPLGEPARPAFARVRLLSERVQRTAPGCRGAVHRDVARFPRGDPGGRDTPADRHRNHRESAGRRLASKRRNTDGGSDVEPAQEDHGLPRPRR